MKGSEDDVKGLLVLSDRGPVIPDSDRHAIMIFGVVGASKAVAQTFSDEKHWTQRLVTGRAVMDEFLSLSIERDVVENLSENGFAGHRVDQLLCSRIWRT